MVEGRHLPPAGSGGRGKAKIPKILLAPVVAGLAFACSEDPSAASSAEPAAAKVEASTRTANLVLGKVP